MSYGGFAYIYDLLMANVPYEAWVDFIDEIIQKHIKKSREECLVLDLACGTGNITLPLSDMGYDMIGVDISNDMLSQAYAKNLGKPILFLAQDMRHLDLFGTIDAAVCACDGLNYLLEAEELATVFKRVKLFLNPDGVFIFDLNTRFKFMEQLGSKSFESQVNGASYEWDNHYDDISMINTYHVLFTPQIGEPFEEIHQQRAYSNEVVCELLQMAGFNNVTIHDGYSGEAFKEDSERAVFIAR